MASMTTGNQSLFQDVVSPTRGSKRENLNYTKRPLRVGLWNTRTIYKKGNKEQLVKELERYNIDICGVCETHLTGTDVEKIEGWTLINSGQEDIHAHGVGLVLSHRTRTSLLSYETINERIMKARLYARQVKMSIIIAYAPTEEAEEEIKDKFYEDLNAVTDSLPKHDIRIVIGDFNAKVGSDNSQWKTVMGQHGVGVLNDNGRRLVEFSAENDMIIGGTLFPHKTIHKTTWTSPDGITHNQIDHVMINGKWRKSLLDVRVYRGADIGSDHELVIAKVQLKLAAQKKTTKNKKLRSECLLLPQFQQDYEKKIASQFDTLSELTSEPDTDHEWQRFKKGIYDIAEETVGFHKKEHKKWISMETEDLIEKRREAKIMRDQKRTDESKCRYRELDKKVKTNAEKDWKKWIDDQAAALETASNNKNQREVFRKVNILTGKKGKNTLLVKDKSGNIIGDEKARLERWAEHFRELLNTEPPQEVLTNIDAEWDDLDIDLGDPSRGEVTRAVKRLKNNKAAGHDKITAEMLKAGGSKLHDWLTRVSIAVWRSEESPADWKRGVIIKLPQKGDLTICGNNRGITLLSVAGKVFCTIVLLRIRDAVDEHLRENQAGFRMGRSCVDQCFALRQVIEKSLEMQLPVKVNFIDFKAAFDSVHRDSLWKVLRSYGIPEKIVNIMRNTYEGSECCVRVDGEETSWFPVTAGVRQGCIWSPLLFGILIDWVLKNALDRNEMGIVIEKRRSSRYQAQRLADLDFADDIALIDETEERLQFSTSQVEEKGSRVGLTANAKKTQVMPITREPVELTITMGNGDKLEKVGKFVYLGSTMAADGDLTPELNYRIGRAADAFSRVSPILRHRKISMPTKMQIFHAVVITTLLYGAEAWNTTVQEEKRLSAFYRRCLRRIIGVTWQEKMTNEEVYRRTGQPPFICLLRRKRLTWLGHMVRMPPNRLPRRLLFWEPPGKRRPGRQRMRWRDAVTRDLKETTVTFDEAIRIAQDRVAWCNIVKALCGKTTTA